MKKQPLIVIIPVCIGLVAAVSPGQTPLGTAFPYQGQLKNNGLPASGSISLGAPAVNDDIRRPKPAAGMTTFLSTWSTFLTRLEPVLCKPWRGSNLRLGRSGSS